MKRIFYLFCFTVLGIIFSFIVHAIAEYSYISYADVESIIWYDSFGAGTCALPIWLQYSILLFGMLGGIFMGFWGWKIVYVQKRHWRNKS